ncbi:MAG: serine/threonine-protein kinase [Rubripirellula sp.]|nr:serine/threonine-protein kinase [Rubripirellula sp.]
MPGTNPDDSGSDNDAHTKSDETSSSLPTQDLLSTSEGVAIASAPLVNSSVIRYFGEYELIHEIARGGMGVVYKARQTKLNRIVALKMILSGSFANDAQVQRFQAEAEAAANLDHPGIVPVFEIGHHEGQHYFSMAYLPGQSLKETIADRPLNPRDAAEIVSKIASAIGYAHDQGVIHRDLKPANVMIDETGVPKITDFGLAKSSKSSDLTASGQIMGTPNYMAPEQATGETAGVNAASDIYALGAILYETLTARPPFQASTSIETIRQVLESEPVPPRQLNSAIPCDLNTICLKCLEKEPMRRYASPDELAADLSRWLSGFPIHAKPTHFLTRSAKWCLRNPAWAVAIALLAVMSCLFSQTAIADLSVYVNASSNVLAIILLSSIAAIFLAVCLRPEGRKSSKELCAIAFCLLVFFTGAIGILSLLVRFFLHFIS